MELTIYQKLWKPSKNCSVITIQQKNLKILGAETGDIIEAKIKIFKKKPTNKIPLQQKNDTH